MTKRITFGVCLFFLLWALPCRAQIVITSFAPQQAVQGSSFTLMINGSGFSGGAVVTIQFLPGTGISVSSGQVISPNQVVAQVQIAVNAPTTSHHIRVIGAGSAATAPGVFTVTASAGPPPTLTSVGPSMVSQGSQNIRLTLRGTNFRPGARVVISPPLAGLTSSTATQQAADVAV